MKVFSGTVPGMTEYLRIPYIRLSLGMITNRYEAEMMNGSKWASFVLDLSFLGWILLGLLTLGILNLVFTNPYKDATDAELFRWLNGERDAPVIPQPEYMDEAEITAIPAPAEEEEDEVTFVK